MSGPSKDFLLDPGTNGFIATPFNLMTTELNSLATTDSAISSVGGSSGVFAQSNFDNEMLYEVYFVAGGSISSISAGGNLAGWWCKSTDGGTTFEKTVSNTAFPRPPDLLIPLDALLFVQRHPLRHPRALPVAEREAVRHQQFRADPAVLRKQRFSQRRLAGATEARP